ncbi:hypothetical protein [Stigmatella aurantiaca]|uniref:Uncharacterized protein n=1 Tax=Stigmatella aurantiaca (strain DW4/3-1) TaxID=378806 RepID=Q093V0_STIAD|nr:hypothetical protein [Stigmatella aurantiaca]EAU67045.1 hypothetical protein STIAU_3530 [Stigmatella aurantiaca DW4/3-1]
MSLPSNALNDESRLIRPQLACHWLQRGDAAYALSFVGGSDSHAGKPGGTGNGDGGVTGILTTQVTREGFFDAVWNRRTLAATYYGSTGPMPVLFGVGTGGKPLLGGDLGTLGGDGRVTVRVLASSQVEQVQLVVDGCTTATL